jgi:fatty-acyl-CoA synthase
MAEVYYSKLTPQSFLDRSAYVFREKTAIVYGDQRITYPEFAARVNCLANALRSWGLQRLERVAFLCPNIPPMLEAHFGVPLSGGVLVSINTRLNADEIVYILNHSESRLLFVDSELATLIAGRESELTTVQTIVTIIDEQADAPGTKLTGPTYEGFLTGGQPNPVESWLEDENDTISINYTSGTTGHPKGVMYTHRGAYLNALGEGLELGLDSQSNYLWTLPMFHCNGWCFTWGVVAVGATHVCLRKFDPATTIQLIMGAEISHFCGAPTVLIMLVNDPAIKTLQLKRPLHIATAAAPPSPTILQTMESLGAKISHLYGLTETYGPHTICEWQTQWDALPAEQRARIKSRQGVAYIHAVELRVVDEEMNDVPADAETMGEVVMRGNNVMKGYFKNAEATAQAFRGGWFHSGDLGVMHPDGYIELRDRAKDIIISGGENISTIEIERAIYKHPDVLEVAVIGIPHEKWGEAPKAFVTLKPGAEVTEETMLDFCREHLARFKCPKAIEFGGLPKTSTGKIQKFKLRDKEWAGFERRIN